MRRFRDPNGERRLWFEPGEIENVMEAELARSQAMPTLANPVTDMEWFVETHLGAQLDQYADLDSAILGVTEFRVGATPVVRINKDLTGIAIDDEHSPNYMRGRWRATLAHEAAHIILHRRLFNLNPDQRDLFDSGEDDDETNRVQHCLKRNLLFRGTASDWREVQANMGMAALLMPRPLFVQAFYEETGGENLSRGTADVTGIVARLASRFQVSKQAAEIRLSTLQLVSAAGQLKMF